MILSYQELMDKNRIKIQATITTDHPLSSYNQPVIILYGKRILKL